MESGIHKAHAFMLTILIDRFQFNTSAVVVVSKKQFYAYTDTYGIPRLSGFLEDLSFSFSMCAAVSRLTSHVSRLTLTRPLLSIVIVCLPLRAVSYWRVGVGVVRSSYCLLQSDILHLHTPTSSAAARLPHAA